MTRFANYLRNLLPSNDTMVMEMASKAMGRLALTGGTFTADYVEFEVKRALEWLGGDRNEGRRHAAVSKYVENIHSIDHPSVFLSINPSVHPCISVHPSTYVHTYIGLTKSILCSKDVCFC